MTKPELIPVHREDLQVGIPVPFPLFDAHHTLLLGEGHVILSEQQLGSLFEIGLYHVAHWRNGEPAHDVSYHNGQIPKTFSQLKLQPGSALHLRRLDTEFSGFVAVKLIGWLADQDLIVSAITQNHTPLMFPIGTSLEVKLLVGKGIVIFNTSVQATNATPQPYLHLTYPQSLDMRQLRKNLRVNIQLPVLVNDMHDTASHEGVLLNLSASGGMLELPRLFAQAGDELQLILSLPAVGQEHALILRATVRNLHTDGGDIPMVQYGLEFLDADTTERLVLEHFIFQTLLEN